MSAISHTMSGSAEMKRRAKNLNNSTRKSMLKAVDNFTTTEMREMKRRTPVETGELRDSGHTKPARFEGDTVKGEMEFSADHAMVVHEDLEAHHTVGQAKFMESVLNESAPHFPARVAEDMKGDMKT